MPLSKPSFLSATKISQTQRNLRWKSPNLGESMPVIDFTAALGRLLRDGALRDALAADPRALVARLGVRASDQPALLQLAPDDLEFQARVLLRKRFDSLRRILPETCARLGDEAWSSFYSYARLEWPSGDDPATLDACE